MEKLVKLRNRVYDALIVRKLNSDWSVAVPLPSTALQDDVVRLGIHCHIFHVDLASELLNYVQLCPYEYKLVLTTDSEEKKGALEVLFMDRGLQNPDIRITENRGRDVGPRLFGCRDLYRDFELLLFLHTKKTAALAGATKWRHWLLTNNCGSPLTYKSIVSMFQSNPKLGVVFPQSFPSIRNYMGWAGLFTEAKGLCRRMGFDIHRFAILDFPAGSMYWVRPAALAPLLDLDLAAKDFPDESGQRHGTLAHVIERIILHVCEASGYTWVKVVSPHSESSGKVVKFAKQSSLWEYHSKNSIRLL